MIEFARTWAFLLLPLPLLAWYLLPMLPARAAVRVPAGVGHWLMAVSGTGGGAFVSLPRGLVPRVVGWLALIVALAGPHLRGDALLSPTGRDLLVAVDLSASMANTDMRRGADKVERIDVVRDLLGAFVKDRTGDRVGLITFASDAYMIAPLTFDTRAVARMLNEVAIGLPGRKTDLGRAIGLAVQVLRKEPPADRLLVVLSDGETNTGALSALDAAALAAETDIRVHVVGFAGAIDPANVAAMRDVAERTGGRYFAATAPETLGQVYAEIDRLEPTAVDADRPHLIDDWAWAPLTLALGMLLLVGWREVGA